MRQSAKLKDELKSAVEENEKLTAQVASLKASESTAVTLLQKQLAYGSLDMFCCSCNRLLRDVWVNRDLNDTVASKSKHFEAELAKYDKVVKDRDALIQTLQRSLQEAEGKQHEVAQVPLAAALTDVAVSDMIAQAVATAKAQAEAEKLIAIQQAVDAVKKQAQDALTKKRQQRISIITTANVPPPVVAAPPAPTHSATPFKPSIVEAELTDDGEENTDDDGAVFVPSKFTTAKGTPAKVKRGPATSDSESDHDEIDDDEWTDGVGAFSAKPLFDFAPSMPSVKPILKQASSRVESLRNIARSLSVYGNSGSSKMSLVPESASNAGKSKKKVTFVSPVGSGGAKRDREGVEVTETVPMAPVEDAADENYAPVSKKHQVLTSSSVTAAARVPTLASKRAKILG